MGRILKFFKFYHLPLLTGFLFGSSYIPFIPWALFFCYVPLWIFILRKDLSLQQVFIAAWISQFTYTLMGFHWVASLAYEFGHMPWVAAIPVLLVFASLAHLHIPLAAFAVMALRRRFRLDILSSLLLLSLAFVAAGLLWPSIFPWNLGYPLLWAKLPMAQNADVVGFEGLSLFVHLVNAALALVWLKKSNFMTSLVGGLLVLVFGLLHFSGLSKQEKWSHPDRHLKLLQIQANIGNLEKEVAEKGLGYQQFILDEFFNLTREAVQKYPEAELILWPESAFPDVLDRHAQMRPYPAQLLRFLHEIKRPLLTGGYSMDPPRPLNDHRERKEYNGLFLFDEQGNLSEPYHKTYLLIFGEYLPFGDYFPFLAAINPGGSGFGRGSGPVVLNLNDIRIGPQICYEGLYPEFSAELAKKGAHFLVNLTNDSWFGADFEPYQHLYMTFARAIETRRPLIRNTNTGISSAILANGRVLEQSPLQKKWYGLYDIDYASNPELTFYTRFHAWLLPLILLLIGLTVALGKNRDRTPAS